MQHAIINAMKCMRAIKDRIARPVYQMAIISVSLYTRTVYRPGKSSVRDLQSPSAHHSSVVDTRIRSISTDFTTSITAMFMLKAVKICSIRTSILRIIQQISPGTANLKPSLTGHDNSALKQNLKTEENTYPKAYTNRGTLGQDFTESVERTGSSRFLKSTIPVSKLVSIGRESQEDFSATNIIQNNGGTRRQSTEENHGEQ
ncbi:hypothetical protein F511_40271 [Dorcoceras hygrometricum]|uniref:Uncharacterized protein n=1 Tax=Dorcoceras hygrometricum TaxID=472368 RepID=A0A2Z7DD02_9LAMI|nr:hypothetical protein F511_40271 [Dorcoceras hygrometricum]